MKVGGYSQWFHFVLFPIFPQHSSWETDLEPFKMMEATALPFSLALLVEGQRIIDIFQKARNQENLTKLRFNCRKCKNITY